MLAPADQKTMARPSSAQLEEEADRWLARYPASCECPTCIDVYRHRRDASGRPFFPIVARHVELVGAFIWNGRKSEKSDRRPCRYWQWTTTLKTYNPVREDTRPLWTTPHLQEIDVKARQDIDLAIDDWCRIVAAEVDEKPALSPRATTAPHIHIARLGRFFPGACKDDDHPAAAVLRIAFRVLQLAGSYPQRELRSRSCRAACHRSCHPCRATAHLRPRAVADQSRGW